MPAMIQVTERIAIPDAELEVSFARSGGPGGQNVNKVSSKAVLRWRAEASTALPPDAKRRLLEAARSRLTQSGEIVIACDETRDQHQNLSIAEERLCALVRASLVPPKKRRPTRPTRGSKERRLHAKRARAGTKRARGRVDDD